MAKQTRSQNSAVPKGGGKSRQPAPKAQPKPKRINMDAAAEDSTPANVMWKLGILACVLMVVVSLLFASINGGSLYVGEDAKPTPTPTITPPVASTVPDGGEGNADGTQDNTDSSTTPDNTQPVGQ